MAAAVWGFIGRVETTSAPHDEVRQSAFLSHRAGGPGASFGMNIISGLMIFWTASANVPRHSAGLSSPRSRSATCHTKLDLALETNPRVLPRSVACPPTLPVRSRHRRSTRRRRPVRSATRSAPDRRDG